MISFNEAAKIAANAFIEHKRDHHINPTELSGIWSCQKENIAVFCFGASHNLQEHSISGDIVVDEKTQFEEIIEIVVDLLTGKQVINHIRPQPPERNQEMSYAGTKTDCLSTPCGDIIILDESDNRLTFSIENNRFNVDYDLFNGTPESDNDSWRYVNTEHNYSISVAASSLVKGKKYHIILIGTSLARGDSDEHTTCVSGIPNDHCIAIGAYDPNDIYKDEQAWEYSRFMGYLEKKGVMFPPTYDRRRFYMYDVEMLDDYSGYEFELMDDKCTEVSFLVAWIKSKPGKELDYLGAVEFWTT